VFGIRDAEEFGAQFFDARLLQSKVNGGNGIRVGLLAGLPAYVSDTSISEMSDQDVLTCFAMFEIDKTRKGKCSVASYDIPAFLALHRAAIAKVAMSVVVRSIAEVK